MTAFSPRGGEEAAGTGRWQQCGDWGLSLEPLPAYKFSTQPFHRVGQGKLALL